MFFGFGLSGLYIRQCKYMYINVKIRYVVKDKPFINYLRTLLLLLKNKTSHNSQERQNITAVINEHTNLSAKNHCFYVYYIITMGNSK